MGEAFQIRRMRADEIQVAIDWAEREGWNPGIHDAETFFRADPSGFFIGEYEGQAVAVGCAVVYDAHFAFCGLYIVHPDYRGRGFGLQLTRERLRYVDNRNAGIDGVVENIPIYERIGYRLAYNNMRFYGIASGNNLDQHGIILLSQLPFEQIEAYDRECFPATRSAFLEAWINQPDALEIGYIEGGELKGYGVRRKCCKGHKIGPLFADDFKIAEHLFMVLQQGIEGDVLFLDITDINPAARRLVEKHRMEKVFSTGRMYLRGQPDIADQKIFGITTFELG